eukprot:scaffold33888_cov22-Tisochrysis_lutea.AAC.1
MLTYKLDFCVYLQLQHPSSSPHAIPAVSTATNPSPTFGQSSPRGIPPQLSTLSSISEAQLSADGPKLGSSTPALTALKGIVYASVVDQCREVYLNSYCSLLCACMPLCLPKKTCPPSFFLPASLSFSLSLSLSLTQSPTHSLFSFFLTFPPFPPRITSRSVHHTTHTGEPVGGGEAGALLAVYARMASVEEALAQSGALGSALRERLQANEQQMQAFEVQ